jgi:purine nucleoside permease
MMADSERAAALAIGYGVSQTVAAVLLTGRVRSIFGAPHWSVIGRVLVTSMVAAAAAVVAMLVVVARFDTTRSWSLVALLAGGAVGVAVFLAVASAGGGRQFLRLQRG